MATWLGPIQTRTHAVATLARGQHGLITRKQARKWASAASISRRLRLGQWERVRAGVYAVGGGRRGPVSPHRAVLLGLHPAPFRAVGGVHGAPASGPGRAPGASTAGLAVPAYHFA